MSTAMTAPPAANIAPMQPRPTNTARVAVFPGDNGQDVTAIVKTDGRGKAIRNMQTRVPLSDAKDEVWTMRRWSPKTKSMEPSTSITAIGYDKLNLFCGVSFITPETVLDDEGRPRPNPFLKRNPVTDEIEYVRVRIVGLGRNPIGNLVAHDYMLNYDLRTYLAQDIWSKWSGRKSDTAKDWGRVVAGSPPSNLEPHEKAYPIPAGVTLIVNLHHKDVIAILSEHISRQKFAERNATTICRRNIMKKFTAAAKLDPKDFTVPMVAWQQTDLDLVELGEVAAQANTGRILHDGEEVEILKDADTVDEVEQVEEGLAGEADEDDTADEPESPPAAGVDVPAPAKPKSDAANADELRAQIRDLVRRLDYDVAEPCIIGVGGCNSVADVAKVTDVAALQQIKSDLENARLKAAQSAAKKKSGTNGKSTS